MIRKLVLFFNKNSPINYVYRRGQWFYDGNDWVYYIGILGIKFIAKYNFKNNEWYFNFFYRFIFYTINTTYSIIDLKNITNHLQLLKKGYLVLNGIFLRNNNKNILILGPSGNGKSTYVKNISINKNIKVLDDDIVVFNPKDKVILYKNTEYNVDKILFFYNSTKNELNTNNFKNKNIFLISLATSILGNELSKNIIFIEELQEKIDFLYSNFLKLEINFINITNYNYEKLNKNIGLE